MYDCNYEENIYVVIPPGHALYEKNHKQPMHVPFHPSCLNKEKFILLKPGLGLRRLTDHILEHYNIQPNIVLETNNI
ncbi:LysR family transcriptional regulator substrate-binding protein [Bacillus sp. JJ634]